MHNEFDYIDGITIIDNDGTILFTVKFNPEYNKDVENSIIGKKLSEIFPNINKENSSLLQCMKDELPVVRKKQLVKDLFFGETYTNNISIPIKNQGRVVGAIELSQELRDKEESNKNLKLEINPTYLGGIDQARYKLEDIVGTDKKMELLKNYARKIAPSDSPVFIIGESGTGKELFAQGIHNASNRREKPFIAQNCSAIPENLLESTFFGTSKGSFTGAVNKQGLFEAANEGTLFLDELHSMPIHLQAKLLRAVENGSARRIGENTERKFNVRIIAATNIAHQDILNGQAIREDLFYRLAVAVINIPPLRERKGDILLLSKVFIRKYNKVFHKNIRKVSDSLQQFLMNAPWKGNVRELENYIQSLMIIVSDESRVLEDMSLEHSLKHDNKDSSKPINKILNEIELELLEEALHRHNGNVQRTASFLEIPRQTLQQKMLKYNLKEKTTKRLNNGEM